MERRWYVIYSNIKCEERAARGLRNAGFEVYLPKVKVEKLVRRTRRRQTIEKPMFSRYLFVTCDGVPDWMALRGTDGVEGYLRNNGAPMTVPQAVIEDLQVAEDMGLFDQCKRGPIFEAGVDVRIVDGPFQGFMAVVKSALPRKSAEVLVGMFTVHMDVEFLRAA